MHNAITCHIGNGSRSPKRDALWLWPWLSAHTHTYTLTPTHIDTHLPNTWVIQSVAVFVPSPFAAAVAGKQHFSAFFTYLQIFSFLVFGLLISGPGLERERETRESKSVLQMPTPTLSPQRMRGNYGVAFFAALSTQLKALKCNATKAICEANQFSI